MRPRVALRPTQGMLLETLGLETLGCPRTGRGRRIVRPLCYSIRTTSILIHRSGEICYLHNLIPLESLQVTCVCRIPAVPYSAPLYGTPFSQQQHNDLTNAFGRGPAYTCASQGFARRRPHGRGCSCKSFARAIPPGVTAFRAQKSPKIAS